MSKEKKKWEAPKLICLYRGRPEEAVLQTCKTGGSTGPVYKNCKETGIQKCPTAATS